MQYIAITMQFVTITVVLITAILIIGLNCSNDLSWKPMSYEKKIKKCVHETPYILLLLFTYFPPSISENIESNTLLNEKNITNYSDRLVDYFSFFIH